MTSDRETLGRIGSWMENGRTRLPDHVLHAVLDQLPATPQHGPRWWAPRSPTRPARARLAAAAVAIVAISVIGRAVLPRFDVGPVVSPIATQTGAPSATPEASASTRQPSAGLGTTPPVAAALPCTKPISDFGTHLACSRDGTRLLVQRDRENLFVVHADGSETQVTTQLSGFSDIPGSSRPRGATISPDGSRIVFAGLTKAWKEGRSCHDGALFAVDADGGPVELLWTSQSHNGIVNYPTFSPDGTQIAFADGYCDNDHSVWLMNADGSDARKIVSSDIGPLGGTHVYGLEWSKDGDRIAINVDDGVYVFATDGSGFARLSSTRDFCWLAPRC